MSPFVTLFLSALWAAPAAAAEEHAASITDLTFPLVNFLIFLYLIKRYLLPLAKDYFKGRREEIAAAVREADEAKRRADALLRDYRDRLAGLDQETTEIREALRGDGDREKARLLAEAAEIAVRVKADGDFLAEQEVKLARQELRREIIGAAQAATEKLVQSHLTGADQGRMVAEFVSEVEEAR